MTRTTKCENVFRFLGHGFLDVFYVLGAVIPDQGELQLKEGAVAVEPHVGDLFILSFAREEVDEVDDDSNDHEDFNVVVVPVGLEMGGDVCDFEFRSWSWLFRFPGVLTNSS